MRLIRRIVVHHSASPRETTIEQIRDWHRAKGWNEIGYHLLVTGDAAVRAGRDLQVQGAHAKGHNRDSIGVCVIGDNTRPEHAWTADQILTLRLVLRGLLEKYPEAEMLGHRDLPDAATLCPGLDVRELLASTK